VIRDIPPAAEIAERLVTDAEQRMLGRRNCIEAA